MCVRACMVHYVNCVQCFQYLKLCRCFKCFMCVTCACCVHVFTWLRLVNCKTMLCSCVYMCDDACVLSCCHIRLYHVYIVVIIRISVLAWLRVCVCVCVCVCVLSMLCVWLLFRVLYCCLMCAVHVYVAVCDVYMCYIVYTLYYWVCFVCSCVFIVSCVCMLLCSWFTPVFVGVTMCSMCFISLMCSCVSCVSVDSLCVHVCHCVLHGFHWLSI